MATSPSDPPDPPDLSGGRDPAPPTPEEVAANVAAVTVAWPAPPVPASEPARRPPGWRFSGRWWAPDDVRRGRR